MYKGMQCTGHVYVQAGAGQCAAAAAAHDRIRRQVLVCVAGQVPHVSASTRICMYQGMRPYKGMHMYTGRHKPSADARAAAECNHCTLVGATTDDDRID